MQKLKVPDDHMVMHVHTSTFQRRWTLGFLVDRNFRILGVFFFIEVRQQHCLLCADQCPKVVSKVSILLSIFFMPLFQILLRARAQEKKKPKWHTFLGCGPSSFS